MLFVPTRETFLDWISVMLVLLLALTSALAGMWLALPSCGIAFCWILIARIRADTIRIQRHTIDLQWEIIESQRLTMNRMLGPHAQLSWPGDGPS